VWGAMWLRPGSSGIPLGSPTRRARRRARDADPSASDARSARGSRTASASARRRRRPRGLGSAQEVALGPVARQRVAGAPPASRLLRRLRRRPLLRRLATSSVPWRAAWAWRRRRRRPPTSRRTFRPRRRSPCSAAIRSGTAAGAGASGATAISSPAICARSARAPPRGSRRGTAPSQTAPRASRSAGAPRRARARRPRPARRPARSSVEGATTSSAKYQRLHHQHLAVRPHGDEVALLAQHDAGDRDLLGVAHRLEHQPVGLRRAGRRREVVRLVVEDRVDLREIDELARSRSAGSSSDRATRARPARSRRSGRGRSRSP